MKNYMKISLGCLTSMTLLTACATSQPALNGQLDRSFGSAVKANVAMQSVEPTAAEKANTFIPADPTRARQARQNYRDNKIPEPQRSDPTSN